MLIHKQRYSLADDCWMFTHPKWLGLIQGVCFWVLGGGGGGGAAYLRFSREPLSTTGLPLSMCLQHRPTRRLDIFQSPISQVSGDIAPQKHTGLKSLLLVDRWGPLLRIWKCKQRRATFASVFATALQSRVASCSGTADNKLGPFLCQFSTEILYRLGGGGHATETRSLSPIPRY